MIDLDGRHHGRPRATAERQLEMDANREARRLARRRERAIGMPPRTSTPAKPARRDPTPAEIRAEAEAIKAEAFARARRRPRNYGVKLMPRQVRVFRDPSISHGRHR